MLRATGSSARASSGVSGEPCPVAIAMSQAWIAASRAAAAAAAPGAISPWGSGVGTAPALPIAVHGTTDVSSAWSAYASGSALSWPEGGKRVLARSRRPGQGRSPRLLIERGMLQDLRSIPQRAWGRALPAIRRNPGDRRPQPGPGRIQDVPSGQGDLAHRCILLQLPAMNSGV